MNTKVKVTNIKVWIPGSSDASSGVEGSNIFARLSTDIVELSTRIDRTARDDQGINPTTSTCFSPSGGGASSRVKGRDTTTYLSTDSGEIPPYIDRIA